ncbi:MAG: hypothetical protein K2X48_12155 [Chitinophagaceae bacterium]|nr:hypothetical protein [Chitinophagaceae bacterium]
MKDVFLSGKRSGLKIYNQGDTTKANFNFVAGIDDVSQSYEVVINGVPSDSVRFQYEISNTDECCGPSVRPAALFHNGKKPDSLNSIVKINQ